MSNDTIQAQQLARQAAIDVRGDQERAIKNLSDAIMKLAHAVKALESKVTRLK